jgi:hypothetical protein
MTAVLSSPLAGTGRGRIRLQTPQVNHAVRLGGAAPRRARGRVAAAAAPHPSSSGATGADAAVDPLLKLGSRTSVSLVGAWETGGKVEAPAVARDGGATASSSGNGAATAVAGGGLPKADHGKFVHFFR